MENVIEESNDFLQKTNDNKLITNAVELREWLVSIQIVEHENVAWDILHGMWDNDELIKDIEKLVKNHLGVDFSDYQDLGWFKTSLNCGLRQFRKKVNDNVKKTIGVTIDESYANHKLYEKNYCKKRKKGVFEAGFVHYPNGDGGKNRRNKFCEKFNRNDLKVHVKKLILQKRLDRLWPTCKFTFFFLIF